MRKGTELLGGPLVSWTFGRPHPRVRYGQAGRMRSTVECFLSLTYGPRHPPCHAVPAVAFFPANHRPRAGAPPLPRPRLPIGFGCEMSILSFPPPALESHSCAAPSARVRRPPSASVRRPVCTPPGRLDLRPVPSPGSGRPKNASPG